MPILKRIEKLEHEAHTARTAGLVTFSVGLLAIVAVAWPYAEGVLWPAAVQMPSRVTSSAEGATVNSIIDKRRKCRWRESSFIAGLPGAPAARVHPTRPGNVPGGPRPPGVQSLGDWFFPNVPPGAVITGSMIYECHPLWEVTVPLGPWKVPPLGTSVVVDPKGAP